MAFLDFIKNRDGQRTAGEQQSQQQKPETYKEMNNRLDVQEKASAKPVASIPDSAKSELQEIRQSYEKGTQPIRAEAPASTPEPESGGSPEAFRQKMMGQGKAAAELSPTDANSGKTVADDKTAQPQKEEAPGQQAPLQQKSPSRSGPSWER